MKKFGGLLVSLGFAVTLLAASALFAANTEINPAGPGKVQVGSGTLSGSNATFNQNLPGESWKANFAADANRLDFTVGQGQPSLLFPTLGITAAAGQGFSVVLDAKGRPVQIELPCGNPGSLQIFFPDGSSLIMPEGITIRINYLADGTIQIYFEKVCKHNHTITFTDSKGNITALHAGETINVLGFMALPDWRQKGPDRGVASPPQI